MSEGWKIHIAPAGRKPFMFVAKFSGQDGSVLDARYLYGDGDLAVFLEDLGAAKAGIGQLLDTLYTERVAEISIDVTEEAMEVLARRPPAL